MTKSYEVEDRRLRRKTAAFRLKHDVGKALRWSAPEEREADPAALRARVLEPAASAEPELLSAGTAPPSSGPLQGEDRYTTSLGFSPDGRLLLVVCEGFTPDGVRIPKRHVLCDTDGGRRPVLVDRPYSAPGVVDWDRLQQLTERLSG